MKKKILIFLVFLSIGINHAQTRRFAITWEEKMNVSTDQKPIYVPGFDAANFSYDAMEGLRYYAQWEETGSFTNPTITGIVSEPISASQLQDLDISIIPNKVQFTHGRSRARGVSYAWAGIAPIYKDNGILKRVTAFTVGFSAQRSNQKQAINTLNVTNSVLASGDFFKFYIDKTGVFKLDKQFLESLGMNVNAIDPNALKIYGNGGEMLPLLNMDNTVFDPRENSIKVVGGNDGSFDTGDYILFYGVGTRGFNEESLTHINAYDDRSYYFITAGGSTGKRITTMQQPQGSATQQITTFDDYQFHEEDNENLVKLGRRWFGERFDFQNEQDFVFDFPNLVAGQPVKVRAYAAAISESPTGMNVSVNGQSLTTLNFSPISDAILAQARSYDSFYNPAGNPGIGVSSSEITVNLSYSNGGNPSSRGYLDFIALQAERELRGAGAQLAFQKNTTINASGVAEYVLQDAAQFSEIWEVTDPFAIKTAENTGNLPVFSFKSAVGVLRKFVAVNPDDFYVPLRENGNTRLTNQNLKGTIFNGNGGFQDIDYLMVTSDLLRPQAERLAQHNRDIRGLNVKVVTIDEIYNEFSSGHADIGAIRNFVRYVYENASSEARRLRYLCLFGDTSIDYKDRIPGNNNIVPTFNTYNSFSQATSYMSDDYFGSLDPFEGIIEDGSPIGSGGRDRLDIAVGRIIADTPQLANQVVNKIINYDLDDSFGRWRNNFVLVSDDVDVSWEFTELESTLDALGDDIQREKPFVNVVKIHSDSYQQESSAGGDRYPEVNLAIADALEVGTLVLNYLGHGSEDTLASEFIFTRANAQALNNGTRLPVIVTVTCEFTRFDNPTRPAAGEELFWNADGGAVGLVATTRQISVRLGVNFNRVLAGNLFSFGTNTIRSVAENLRETKNMINDSKRRVIFFIGDPAMKLAFPQPSIRLTTINDVPLTQAVDTLKALSKVKLGGEVINAGGQRIPNYNGTLSATVYDKYIDRQTLGNDGTRGANGNLLILDFKSLGTILYRGQASIDNGGFNFDFVVPKDALIPTGNGRVSLYAKRENQLEDQTGANQQIIVGGLNENAPEDNTGPLIKLYMNDESFVNGGVTNTSPFLLVQLEDDNGINTASGIGHDLVAILDGNETEPIILNDFYESDVDNFNLGKALRKLRDLEPGLHTVSVKAWDTYNNSSTADLQFVVAGDDNIQLENVLNYPNPFVNYTEFWFNHNRPYEPLDVQVQIFTISGKVVKTINRNVMTTGFLSREITWDGRDDFGDKIGKGVYVYKITVKSTLTNKKVEKFEKLVIL
ncbi:type IX secretion system sortase PorU [Flavimarina sp. Hel_I_48]|uniref:type IX secretion system sortase PorU n=1 Tax=Flavimarina sp. Hel_I_48 TaxID=1392488 RepID=UPI0004DF455F|nr:type IX secretion system sortase PorU [Flavimarina sp. Hel_I_48]